ncbi:MAG: cell wall hydrolase [Patescibacteria group bacterium]
MPKIIILKLTSITYSGKSIGDDIGIEIEVLGSTTQFATKLKKSEHIKTNLQIGTTTVDKKIVMIPVTIRVTERDILFSDKGNIKATIKIDPNVSFPQMSVHHVDVKEFRAYLTKSTARFELIIAASVARAIKKRISSAINLRWTGDFHDDPEDIILARLIFGEAEDQSREAKIWIGGSVLNRVRAKAWPNTIQDVVLQRGQYDPFKKTDRNFKKITDPLTGAGKARKTAWEESYEMARGLLSGNIANPSTATHFHGRGISCV